MSAKNSYKIKGIDHIGIATKNLNDASKFWQIIGLDSKHDDEVIENQGVKIRFFEFENHTSQTRIELLEPTAENTPIGKFITNRGIGIQQICLEVEGLDELLTHLKSNGIALIDEIPKLGANNCRIAFVHPKSTGGVLVELSEGSI